MSSSATTDTNGSKNYFVNFNQDTTSLAIGGKFGYKLFSLASADYLQEFYSNATEDACIVERLFSSCLVAMVSLAAPRKLKVCHFRKGTEICNYSYSNTILAVKLNRARLVVCLEESLYIHNIRDMKVLHTIRDTPQNPKGLCALSTAGDYSYLAYPGSSAIGEVQIFDAGNLNAKLMIQAHDSPLAALAFDPNGTKIATASEKGTVIRVFSVNDGKKLFEFRRGMKRCVSISCLSFSLCGQYLACSSNTETVHIFKLEEPKDSPKSLDDSSSSSSTWVGYFSTYLPTQVTDVLTQGRSFATAHLPVGGVKNVISIVYIQDGLRLLVATEEGVLYIYNFNTLEGGDLQLHKQFQLDEIGESDRTDGTGPQDTEATATVSESEKLREITQATELPPHDAFHFTDIQEYPPLTQNSELD